MRDALGEFTLLLSRDGAEASDSVREALRTGHDRIVSAGGDGTNYAVVNGFFDGLSPINPAASMALLPLGTSSDFRKSVGIPYGRAAVPFLASPDAVPIDAVRLYTTSASGVEEMRYFLNILHMGLGGFVVEYAERGGHKGAGGFLAFLVAVIRTIVAHRPIPMEINLDGETIRGRIIEVIAANGQYDGGGIHSAPKALLNDGLLDVYVIGEVQWVKAFFLLHHLYRGTMEKFPFITYRRVTRLEVSAATRTLAAPDGELAGVLPARVELVPGALNLVVAPNALGIRR